MLTKLRNISKRVNPYGGINFVIDEVRRLKLPQLIDSSLGQRVKQAKYSYSDIILGWAYANLCGAQRLEDVQYLKQYFQDIPETKFPSPDRIAGIFKSFKTYNDYFSGTRKGHFKKKNSELISEININTKLNDLLIDLAIRLQHISPAKRFNTLDYDVVVIPTEKKDSKSSYKLYPAYSPAVSMIGRTPVYIEGRNGNVSPSARVKETLAATLESLEKRGVRVTSFRSDAAAYRSQAIRYLHEKGITFYIRAIFTEPLVDRAYKNNSEWERVTIAGDLYDLTSMPYKMKSYKEEMLRVLIVRKVIPTTAADGNPGERYLYNALITNDFERSEKKVLEFYNQRGDAENNFSSLLNDFNWKRIPFSYLNENTVFLLFSAMIYMIYRHLIINFSECLKWLYPNCELKAFIFRFISVAIEWVLEDEEKIPIIYDGERFTPLNDLVQPVY